MKTGILAPLVAPITAEPAGALPTYGTAIEGMGLGSFSMSMDVSNNNGYADNRVFESEASTTNVTFDVEFAQLPTEFYEKVLGYIADSADANTLYMPASSGGAVGFGCIATIQEQQVPKFYAMWFPKVVMALSGDDYETREDNTTWGRYPLSGTAMPIEITGFNAPWFRSIAVFATRAAADAWIQGFVTGSFTPAA